MLLLIYTRKEEIGLKAYHSALLLKQMTQRGNIYKENWSSIILPKNLLQKGKPHTGEKVYEKSQPNRMRVIQQYSRGTREKRTKYNYLQYAAKALSCV